MITIDVKTKAVTNAREHAPQVYSKTYPRMNITPGYIRAWCEPNYPMPAIDYYNSNHPIHVAIGNLMEWTIPLAEQLKHRT